MHGRIYLFVFLISISLHLKPNAFSVLNFGATFRPAHPQIIPKANHISAVSLESSWPQDVEWSIFTPKLDSSVAVAASANKQPILWCRDRKRSGRFWFTGIGHSDSLYKEKRKQLLFCSAFIICPKVATTRES